MRFILSPAMHDVKIYSSRYPVASDDNTHLAGA